ncbi:hypothetical protein IPG36_00555 [bacterium]|nr:MAG: hypothetical protein IPG36_00555 [bacterium]
MRVSEGARNGWNLWPHDPAGRRTAAEARQAESDKLAQAAPGTARRAPRRRRGCQAGAGQVGSDGCEGQEGLTIAPPQHPVPGDFGHRGHLIYAQQQLII